MPSSLVPLGHVSWTGPADPECRADALLESGDVLFFPSVPFPIEPDERALFSPAILSSSKNTSFDPATGRVSGTTSGGDDLARLGRMMQRFSTAAAALVARILPRYASALERGRASFRPAEIAGRQTSWRKDDTRLHVDSFPASPVQGRRILRVFSNVNPEGRPRQWRIGDDFGAVASRFAGALSVPWPGVSAVLRAVGATKTRRSDYDALMLQLHDCMKADLAFQRTSPQATVDLPAGTTWVAFTDQVSHAAMAGQYQLEQTFYVPVSAMLDERRSPLRILEASKGRRLV